MNKIYVIEVVVDEAELEALNQKRRNVGLQQRTADELIETLVADGLATKLFALKSFRPKQQVVLVQTGGDPNATL